MITLSVSIIYCKKNIQNQKSTLKKAPEEAGSAGIIAKHKYCLTYKYPYKLLIYKRKNKCFRSVRSAEELGYNVIEMFFIYEPSITIANDPLNGKLFFQETLII